jgi:hypothetical protein
MATTTSLKVQAPSIPPPFNQLKVVISPAEQALKLDTEINNYSKSSITKPYNVQTLKNSLTTYLNDITANLKLIELNASSYSNITGNKNIAQSIKDSEGIPKSLQQIGDSSKGIVLDASSNRVLQDARNDLNKFQSVIQALKSFNATDITLIKSTINSIQINIRKLVSTTNYVRDLQNNVTVLRTISSSLSDSKLKTAYTNLIALKDNFISLQMSGNKMSMYSRILTGLLSMIEEIKRAAKEKEEAEKKAAKEKEEAEKRAAEQKRKNNAAAEEKKRKNNAAAEEKKRKNNAAAEEQKRKNNAAVEEAKKKAMMAAMGMEATQQRNLGNRPSANLSRKMVDYTVGMAERDAKMSLLGGRRRKGTRRRRRSRGTRRIRR